MATTTLISNGGTLTISPTGNSNNAAGQTSNRATFGATTLNGDTTFVTQNMSGTAPVSNLSLGAIKDNGFATTWFGGGNATTLPGDSVRLNVVRASAGDQTGNWVIGNPTGTQGVQVSLGVPAGSSDQALTTGNVTVNPFGQLLIFTAPAATFGGSTQTLTINGIGAATTAGTGVTGALRVGFAAATPTTYTFNGNLTVGNLAPVTTVNVVNANVTLAVGGTFAANGTLQLQGLGGLTLNGPGGGTGGTQITGGTLTVNAGSALGTGDLTLMQTGTNNTALALNNLAQTVGTLGSTFAATTGTLTQTITLNGTALTVNQAGTTTFGTGATPTLTSTLTGTGSLTLGAASTGTLTLTGANTYSGGTTVNAGTLVASGQAIPDSATGTGPVAVSGANAVLAGGATGRVGGPITVGGGGTVAPGAAAAAGGTLTAGGNVTVQNTGKLALRLGSGGTSDALALDTSGSVLNFVTGSVLALTPLSGSTPGYGTYTLVTLPAGTGNNIQRNGAATSDGDLLGQYVQGAGSTGTVIVQPSGFTLQPGDTFTFQRSGDNLVVNFSPAAVVPEPATVGLAAAAGLGLLLRRRRGR
jgi:autotransporter-associated beta strand protein